MVAQAESTERNQWVTSALLGATPFAVAAIQFFIFARGDMDTFSTLVYYANLGTVWLLVLVNGLFPGLPVFAVVYGLYAWTQPLRHIDIEDGRVVPKLGWRRIAGTALAATVLQGLFFNAPLSFLFVAVSLAGLVVLHVRYFLRPAKRLEQRPGENSSTFAGRVAAAFTETRQIARATLFSIVGTMLVLTYTNSGLPLPLEFVRVEGESAVSAGYVLNVDDVALTLAYSSGGVRHIPVADVTERFSCPDAVVNSTATPVQRMLGQGEDRDSFIPDECFQVLSGALRVRWA